MNKVTAIYNPYLPELKIYINGRNLSSYSALMEYKHVPFVEWCEVFFEEIYKEVNDIYNLHFIAGEFETEIMEKLASKDTYCKCFTCSEPPINKSIYERMGELESLGINSDEDKSLKVVVWDEKSTLVDAMFEILDETGVFTYESDKTMVCSDIPLVTLELEKVEQLYHMDLNNYTGIVLLEEYPDEEMLCELERLEKAVVAFIIGSNTAFMDKIRNVFIYMVDVDNIADCLMNIITGCRLCDLLSEEVYNLQNMLDSGQVFLTDTEHEILETLSLIQPIYKVKAPNQIYLGRNDQVLVKEIPALEDNKYYFVCSKEGVIKFSEMNMETLSPGKTQVELFKENVPEPIAEFYVEVVKANLIREIKLFPKTKYLAVHMTETLELEVIPPNAANVHELSWEVSNSSVASVNSQGMIEGINCGVCEITVSTNEASASAYVEVQPSIKDIVCTSSYVELNVGDQREWKFEVIPENCYERDLIKIHCSDNTIATYRGGYIIGKSPGNTNITIYTPDNKISRNCRITVKRGSLFR